MVGTRGALGALFAVGLLLAACGGDDSSRPELSDFVGWGLDLVVPDSPDEGFEYWETLSWENADKYQADLLIVDERSYPTNLENAEAEPTWSSLAAADAGAVAVWPAYWVRTYEDYAGALDELTAAIEDADENLVP